MNEWLYHLLERRGKIDPKEVWGVFCLIVFIAIECFLYYAEDHYGHEATGWMFVFLVIPIVVSATWGLCWGLPVVIYYPTVWLLVKCGVLAPKERRFFD